MNQTGNEALWQHVAELRPRLREHVRLLPQDYRGERWYKGWAIPCEACLAANRFLAR
jgi:hypothetical protein